MNQAPNPPTPGKAGSRLRLTIEHHRPGLPDTGRSAMRNSFVTSAALRWRCWFQPVSPIVLRRRFPQPVQCIGQPIHRPLECSGQTIHRPLVAPYRRIYPRSELPREIRFESPYSAWMTQSSALDIITFREAQSCAMQLRLREDWEGSRFGGFTQESPDRCQTAGWKSSGLHEIVQAKSRYCCRMEIGYTLDTRSTESPKSGSRGD